MFGVNQRLLFRENQRPLDHILQFANVARPGRTLQPLQCRRRQLWRGQMRGIFPQKVGRQLRNVFRPLAQRGMSMGKPHRR